MNPARVRSRLITVACIVLVVLAWVYMAPTQIGGSTRYVITSGISMEPRFHRGDLALVRPAAQYRVGDVAAYYSPLLRVVVLHRIVARDGARYVFKGDNNNFKDPVQPVQSQLLGKLWLHVRQGGAVLRWIHTPLHAALIVAAFVILALVTGNEDRRRRRRHRTSPPGAQGPPPVKIPDKPFRPAQLGTVLAAALAAVVAFLGLAIFAFIRPLTRPAPARTAYTQKVQFAYGAQTPRDPVYPTGTVTTGDPIFLAFIHQLGFTVGYHLSTQAPHELTGSMRVVMQLQGPTGWTRSLPLMAPVRFAGDTATAHVTVDLAAAEALVTQVENLTHEPDGAYTLSIVPHVRLHGYLGDGRLQTAYAPLLSFQLSASQLQPGGGPTATMNGGASTGQGSFTQSQRGSVATAGSASNPVDLLSHRVSVALVRWLAVLGLFISVAVAVFVAVLKRAAPFDEAGRIQAEYGHLIVPVMGVPEGLAGSPVDVPTMSALARLAECGQRLILHCREHSRDTYLVNDDGTVYRYTADSAKVVWGEWSARPRPLEGVTEVSRSAPAPAPVPALAADAAPIVFPPPAFVTASAASAPAPPPVPPPVPPPAPAGPAQPTPTVAATTPNAPVERALATARRLSSRARRSAMRTAARWGVSAQE